MRLIDTEQTRNALSFDTVIPHTTSIALSRAG